MGLAGWRSGGFYLLVERILPVGTSVQLLCILLKELRIIKKRWLALLESRWSSSLSSPTPTKKQANWVFRHASHLALNCFCFPTHLPITLNILFCLRVTETQGHRTSNHGSTFAFSDALISSTLWMVVVGLGTLIVTLKISAWGPQ